MDFFRWLAVGAKDSLPRRPSSVLCSYLHIWEVHKNTQCLIKHITDIFMLHKLMARYKHRCYWHCTSVCAESRTKMHGWVCKHVLQADLCKPIKFLCAVWYISMKMCFASIIEAILKCRFNKDQRWSLASVCLPRYAYVLELQNLSIIFHLLSDKQHFSVSKWSSTITYMQPKVGGIMFSQQVPGIMEYFFKPDINISKAVSVISAGTSSVSVLLPFPRWVLPGFCFL